MRLQILIVFLLVLSCGKPALPDEIIGNAATETYRMCIVYNMTYYISTHFIYQKNEFGHQMVYSRVGTYTKPKDYPRWQFLQDFRENRTLWDKYNSYIDEGKLPDDTPIECIDVGYVPEGFREFMKNHNSLFEK